MSRFAKIVVFGSLFLVIFGGTFAAGFAARDARVWPTNDFIAMRRQFNQWRAFGVWGRPDEFIPAPVAADDPRVRIHMPEAFEPGYRAIMGYDTDLGTFSVRLLDSGGEIIHVWPLRADQLGMDAEYAGDLLPHGLHVLPNGSIVVNQDHEFAQLARLDACGQTEWLSDGMFHHSMEMGEDGLLWMWMSRDVMAPGEVRRNNVNAQIQSMVAVDPESGEVIREIRLDDVAAVSRRNKLALSVPDGYEFREHQELQPHVWRDIFHANDVEPLPAAMADAFDGFTEGDLLVSLRNNNMVAVIDDETLEILWAQYGPWYHQHDPDYRADGTIVVYNNGRGRGGTHLIRVDPDTGEMSYEHPPETPHIYSLVQGKHQLLPNGASLIGVPDQGWVVEVSPEGEMIFEFVNVGGDGFNGRIMNALWYPPDHFETLPSCPDA